MMRMSRQQGFTLVEIAIVLVIIGLLLGGILKGQELITSARVRNLAEQNSGVQAAYYGFIDRYRQIPGDMTAANAVAAIGNTVPAGIGGNGNNRLEEDGTGAQQWTEAAALWVHLTRAGFLQGNYNSTGAAVANEAAYALNTIAPINAFNGYLMLTRTDDYQDLGGTPPVKLALVLGNQIPVNVLRELDVKVDDSAPRTGVLRASPSTAGQTGNLNTGAADCVDATASPPIWNINANEQNCGAVYLY